MKILAIDPGSELSALVEYDTELQRPGHHAKLPNEELLAELPVRSWIPGEIVVIEMMTPRGQPTSRQEMETLVWVGRFMQAARPARVERLEREKVKRHLIGSHHVKGGPTADSRIRAVLIDRFGGIGGKEAAIGRKASPGPLYGIVADEWAALALAVAWCEINAAEPLP